MTWQTSNTDLEKANKRQMIQDWKQTSRNVLMDLIYRDDHGSQRDGRYILRPQDG